MRIGRNEVSTRYSTPTSTGRLVLLPVLTTGINVCIPARYRYLVPTAGGVCHHKIKRKRKEEERERD